MSIFHDCSIFTLEDLAYSICHHHNSLMAMVIVLSLVCLGIIIWLGILLYRGRKSGGTGK